MRGPGAESDHGRALVGAGIGAGGAAGLDGLRELRPRRDRGGAQGQRRRQQGYAQLRGRGAAVPGDRPLSRGAGPAGAVRRHGGRPARGQGALRARHRHARAGPRHLAAADAGQVAGARCPGTAHQADRDQQPKLSATGSGRDQRQPADGHRAPARSSVLRADLVADHPAGQGPARVRQGAGLCPAPCCREPGDAQLHQRRRPRSPGLCRAEARADPGLRHPVDLLDDLTQLE